MAKTLSDLRGLVQENIHNDTSITAARINTWINLAQDEVERAFLQRYLRQKSNIVTESGVQEYVLIERNFRAFFQFWQTDTPAKLEFIPYQNYIEIYPDPEIAPSQRPLAWSFLGFTSGFPTILFHPIPDAVYAVPYEFWENLPDLTSDSDVSILSQLGWDDLLIDGATKRYQKIFSPEDYLVTERKFQSDLKEFKEEFKQVAGQRRTLRDVLGTQFSTRSFFQLPPDFPQR